MEFDDGVAEDVTHVHLTPFFDHLWVLFDHEPTHVCEEEAAVGVVRVSVRFAVFVVHAVVPHPLENRVLEKMKKFYDYDQSKNVILCL
jgi:hypothetical protein